MSVVPATLTTYEQEGKPLKKGVKMTQLTASVEEYRVAQQGRYAIERERYLSTLSTKKLTIRQTQILMNKYSLEKAIYIASRYNQMKGVK